MTTRTQQFDVVFALNFGMPAGLPANRLIAAAAVAQSRAHGIPVFSAPLRLFDLGDYSNQIAVDFPGYVSTVKQVDALKIAATQNGWRRVLVVAAPPHEWRALGDVRAAGLTAEADRTLRAHPRGVWYAHKSEHRQTRSWAQWWFTWELPARAVLILCRRCYERRARL